MTGHRGEVQRRIIVAGLARYVSRGRNFRVCDRGQVVDRTVAGAEHFISRYPDIRERAFQRLVCLCGGVFARSRTHLDPGRRGIEVFEDEGRTRRGGGKIGGRYPTPGRGDEGLVLHHRLTTTLGWAAGVDQHLTEPGSQCRAMRSRRACEHGHGQQAWTRRPR